MTVPRRQGPARLLTPLQYQECARPAAEDAGRLVGYRLDGEDEPPELAFLLPGVRGAGVRGRGVGRPLASGLAVSLAVV